ncbi:hypothetical protein K435DRAFT_966832 [Dendrothele bispora CBS 962.96]|uniref:Uncharacterized protein n=1 Tax=Dendrothele bispora (strain CBS 962.96) TaxID=1314807 RepID=A0A4S8LYH9_DENBC|nr:hypothetical protein K435DRAFT_966832 [Dendrothele bispora CBS 962.96]
MTASSSSKSQSSTGLRGFKQLLKKGWNEVVKIRPKSDGNEEPESKYKPRGRVTKPTSGETQRPNGPKVPKSKPTLSGR